MWRSFPAFLIVRLGSGRRPCPPATNSTDDYLQCLQYSYERGETAFDEVTETPTEAADNEAVEYFEELSRRRDLLKYWDAEVNVFTQKMKEELMDWTVDRALLPRIFVLGDLEPACHLMQESSGFRYSMEHWLNRMLMSNEATLVTEPEMADFVLLPHCATSVFMHKVVQDESDTIKGRFKEANSLAAFRSNSSIFRRKEVYVSYEGNLPASTVLRLDESYLLHKVYNLWPESPAFQHCWQRSSCKFLTGSIYGRHVWRRFADVFGDKVVFITHAGMSEWLRNQPDEYFLTGSEEFGPSGDGNECRASCALHCKLDPPAVLPQDVVLPWVVAFEWTARATAFRQRDILVFYSGTDNSCSRRKLRKVFSGRFEQEMTAEESRDSKDKILIFPSEFRLKQHEWSELAYRSKLCLCPDGDSPNTGRLVEVIMHGCVPVIISNRLQPPFHQYLDWSRIAFFLREDAIPELPRILREKFQGPAGARRLAEKRQLLRQMSHLCDYARDGVGSTVLMALRELARELRGED